MVNFRIRETQIAMIKKIIQYKMTIVLSLVLLIIVFVNITILAQRGYSNDKFPEKLDLESSKSEQIFNDDIFFDYKLSDQNVDGCARFYCYLFVEVKEDDSFIRLSNSKLIDHNSQEGTLIIFGDILKHNNLMAPFKYRFVMEIFSKDKNTNKTLFSSEYEL